MIQGMCHYCGQAKMVSAADQEEADRLATEECDCDLARQGRRLQKVMDALQEIIGETAPDNGWEPVEVETYEAVLGIANQIVEGHIEQVVIKLTGSTLKIKNRGKKIDVSRQRNVSSGRAIEL